jgi:hypothetical protein
MKVGRRVSHGLLVADQGILGLWSHTATRLGQGGVARTGRVEDTTRAEACFRAASEGRESRARETGTRNGQPLL